MMRCDAVSELTYYVANPALCIEVMPSPGDPFKRIFQYETLCLFFSTFYGGILRGKRP